MDLNPSERILHARVQGRIRARLHRALEVLFPDGSETQPDLVFVRTNHLAIETRRGLHGVPDLIVEILAASTAHHDLGTKYELYEEQGVPYYWVVNPDTRTLQPYTLRDGKYVAEPLLGPGDRLTCPLFPDIVLDDVGSIFPDE